MSKRPAFAGKPGLEAPPPASKKTKKEEKDGDDNNNNEARTLSLFRAIQRVDGQTFNCLAKARLQLWSKAARLRRFASRFSKVKVEKNGEITVRRAHPNMCVIRITESGCLLVTGARTPKIAIEACCFALNVLNVGLASPHVWLEAPHTTNVNKKLTCGAAVNLAQLASAHVAEVIFSPEEGDKRARIYYEDAKAHLSHTGLFIAHARTEEECDLIAERIRAIVKPYLL